MLLPPPLPSPNKGVLRWLKVRSLIFYYSLTFNLCSCWKEILCTCEDERPHYFLGNSDIQAIDHRPYLDERIQYYLQRLICQYPKLSKINRVNQGKFAPTFFMKCGQCVLHESPESQAENTVITATLGGKQPLCETAAIHPAGENPS